MRWVLNGETALEREGEKRNASKKKRENARST